MFLPQNSQTNAETYVQIRVIRGDKIAIRRDKKTTQLQPCDFFAS